MIRIIFILLAVLSIQFTSAQKSMYDFATYQEYLASLKLTKEKAEKESYFVRERPDYLIVWNTKYNPDSIITNVDNVDRLPQLTLVNKKLLDQFIEKNMPKQKKQRK